MKKAIAAILQFILFLLVFLAGSLANPFHLKWFVTHPTPTSTRFFVPDGLLLAIALSLLIVLIQTARKRLTTSTPWTIAAILLALLIGFLARFGYATHDLF